MWLRRRIPSLILLFLVAWIIGSLIASGKAGLEIFPLNLWRLISIIQIFPYLLSATLITLTTACVILVVIGFKPFGFKSVKRKPKIPFSRQIWIYTILGNSFFIILFLLALYVVQKKGVPKGVISGLSYQLPETPPPPSSPFPSLVLGYALAYMIMAMFAMGGVILIRVLKELREGQRSGVGDAARASAVEAIQEAVISLQFGGDFRATIIECYRRLCEMLADHGIPIQDHQTAREFGAGVRRVLRVPLQPLMRLTGLFEEARYSLHEIDEEKRDEALQRLTDVRDYLMGEAAIGETYG